ncbi:MAG: hypothetical protein KDD94_01805, partial [Calditrichaeota bacterium]|nr:hypothetical protein [Calditrichota bacterium]
VHGANRLGTNSLLDLVVFGRRAGKQVTEFLSTHRMKPIQKNAGATAETMLKQAMDNTGDQLLKQAMDNTGDQSLDEIRQTMQNEMMDKVSVFREKAGMEEAVKIIKDLKQKYKQVKVRDRSKSFNMDLVEVLEMSYTLDIAEVIAVSALNRTESRGAHSRVDYGEDIHKTDKKYDGNGRNDTDWLKHTMIHATSEESSYKIDYKPVHIFSKEEYPEFQPKERKY